MTEEQIKDECSRLFQAGGPRMFSFDPERGEFRPAYGRAHWAVECAAEGVQVWHRRKQRGVRRYEWVLAGTGQAAQRSSLAGH